MSQNTIHLQWDAFLAKTPEGGRLGEMIRTILPKSRSNSVLQGALVGI